MRLDLREWEGVTNTHDLKYFLSLYVREPAAMLFKHTTDGPGFTTDEEPEHLGETLMIPPDDAARVSSFVFAQKLTRRVISTMLSRAPGQPFSQLNALS